MNPAHCPTSRAFHVKQTVTGSGVMNHRVRESLRVFNEMGDCLGGWKRLG
jgi:hypothetical protein